MGRKKTFININRNMFLYRICKQYGSVNVFAKNMRIPQTTMNRYANIGRIPKDQLVRFANALNIPSSMLIDISEVEEETPMTVEEQKAMWEENEALKAEKAELTEKILNLTDELNEYKRLFCSIKKIFLREVEE